MQRHVSRNATLSQDLEILAFVQNGILKILQFEDVSEPKYRNFEAQE
jgi:hypothetical protein